MASDETLEGDGLAFDAETNIVRMYSYDLNVTAVAPALSEEDVFNSHPLLGFIAYRLPDIGRPVLHPTWLWVDLRKLVVDAAAKLAAGIHQGHRAAGGTLVDGENVARHGYVP